MKRYLLVLALFAMSASAAPPTPTVNVNVTNAALDVSIADTLEFGSLRSTTSIFGGQHGATGFLSIPDDAIKIHAVNMSLTAESATDACSARLILDRTDMGGTQSLTLVALRGRSGSDASHTFIKPIVVRVDSSAGESIEFRMPLTGGGGLLCNVGATVLYEVME